MLTPPNSPRGSLKPKRVSAQIASLKWTRPEYSEQLREMTGGEVDYSQSPAEDFARATITFETEEKTTVIAEITTSWAYVGPGLRLSFELLGPEYSLVINSLDTNSKVFFSRRVSGPAGEDLVEKQNADGLEVTRLLMACYMSAERGQQLDFPPEGLETFVPQVAQGTWKAT